MFNFTNLTDMKKVFRIMGLCALVALAATSCKKEEQKLASSFKAELTQPTSDAKTHLSGSDLHWNSGDAIKVFDNAGTAYLLSTTDNNVKEATFTGETTLDASESYAAFYPAAGATLSGTEVLLGLPAVQTYAEGTFGNATYPMAATNTGTSFTFHSPCGLLAIPVKGMGNIGTIELTGKASENLAGQLRYNLNGEHQGLTNGQATVTLDCGNIALDATNATTFYFVVPAGVFANGFKAVLKNGTTELYTLETMQDNTIAAETIKMMPVVTVSAVAVTTDSIANVGYTDATVSGSYVAPTGMSVTEVGFYFGTDSTAMTTKVQATLATPFSHTFDSLTEATTYYYMAYAKNGENEYTGMVESFTTNMSVVAPTVTTIASTNVETTTATIGGNITNNGGGNISAYGISYSTTDGFVGADGTQVTGSDLNEGAFVVNLTNLTGKTTYYARAYATNEAGTAYGDQVSFTTLQEGIVNGKAKFTINAAGDQVYFSKGNLQYTKSTGIWSFMEHQYDMAETDGQNVGNNYANQDVVSIFGWGASGYNHGATGYQPWSTYSNGYSYNYYAYGSYSNNLYDQTGKADWGYNAIVNGGNQENSGWRTLTNEEWGYVFDQRTTSSGIRYAKATVNSITGVILLPDNWNISLYALNETNNNGNVEYSINNITLEDWNNIFEANGAVLLPAAGGRSNTTINGVNSKGRYWSSSRDGNNTAYGVYFVVTKVTPQDPALYRAYGRNVRLVYPVE